MKLKSFAVLSIALLLALNCILLFTMAEIKSSSDVDGRNPRDKDADSPQVQSLVQEIGYLLSSLDDLSQEASDTIDLLVRERGLPEPAAEQLEGLEEKEKVLKTQRQSLLLKIRKLRELVTHESLVTSVNGLSLINMSLFDQPRDYNGIKLEQQEKEDLMRKDDWSWSTLTRYVQREIRKRQNVGFTSTAECDTVRTLTVDMTNACGFACAVHQIGFCFVIAYATNRTLLLRNDESWRYASGCSVADGKKGWECFFQPISHCPPRYRGNEWSQRNDKQQHLDCPYYTRSALNNQVYQLFGWANSDGGNVGIPMYHPPLISNITKMWHGDHRVWFVGQLESYLLRHNSRIQDLVAHESKRMKLDREPYFGIHVRRTDKTIAEARAHAVEEYLNRLSAYLSASSPSTSAVKAHITKKKTLPLVFVATDEPRVLQQEIKSFEDRFRFTWVAFGNSTGSMLSSPGSRWNRAGAQAVILDIHFLSHAEYVVGTLSSQVTRLAFELQQAIRNQNCFNCTQSLDHVWYFP